MSIIGCAMLLQQSPVFAVALSWQISPPARTSFGRLPCRWCICRRSPLEKGEEIVGQIGHIDTVIDHRKT